MGNAQKDRAPPPLLSSPLSRISLSPLLLSSLSQGPGSPTLWSNKPHSNSSFRRRTTTWPSMPCGRGALRGWRTSRSAGCVCTRRCWDRCGCWRSRHMRWHGGTEMTRPAAGSLPAMRDDTFTAYRTGPPRRCLPSFLPLSVHFSLSRVQELPGTNDSPSGPLSVHAAL